MAESRWMFTKEQLMNTPSRKNGIDADKELSYRQQAANLIQDMGQRLSVSQLCINTAIVYMHRFYMFQSFTRFPRNEMAPACLFLAAKLEEQPRKLEHVIKVAHSCLHRDNTPAPDPKTEAYLEQAQTLVINENILLQTLGFEVSVDHPHSHVVKATHLVKASKDLAQTSYFLATNSLHLTTLCLQYRPTIVACVCIHLACKWSNWKIPRSNEGKEWYQYVDRSVTQELLEELYNEFLSVLEKCPHKLRKKIMGWKGGVPEGESGSVSDQNKNPSFDCSMVRDQPRQSSSSSSSSSHYKHTNHDRKESRDPNKHSQSDQKPSQEHHRSRDEQRKEWHQDRKEAHPSSDKKAVPSGDRRDHSDRDHSRKEVGGDRRDGLLERKESHASHPSHSRNEPSSHGDHKDRPDSKHAHLDRKDLPHIRKEPNVNERSHGAPPPSHVGKPDLVSASAEVKKEPVDTHSQSQAQIPSDLRKTKSETALHYKEYLRRKEAEKHEKERLEKERYLKQKAEAEQLNKTFSEGSNREHKHRPPKLDMSLTSHSSETANGQGRSVNADRPYEVNIKSPIKPHHNITVKSPIKSSDLKQPRLEITKVQLTPEKDGSSSVSVNINSDPQLKKMVGSAKQETSGSANSVGSDRTDSVKVRIKQEPGESRSKHELKMKIKQNPGEKSRIKQESENPDSDIKLRPEHSAAPSFKIRELNYNPDSVPDSAVSLKLSIKQEGNSGRVTPVTSRDPASGTSTPVSVKLPTAENSPLKIKISTKGIHNDSDASSGKHSSPHRHHKHKDKHKHKRSKDKHKEKHRDKHSSSSSSTSVAPAGTNGQSLKLSFKLSDIQAHSSSSNDSWSVKHKHEKHGQKASISDTALNRNNNANSQESERQQPWSMSDLISKSSHENSPSRKRRRGSNIEQSHDAAIQPKAAKTEPHRLRRSSSSHSVVSMDMSDGDEDGGAEIQTLDQPKGMVNQLHESLQAAIKQTTLNVMQLQQQQQAAKLRHDGISSKTRTHDRRPQIDRQQSGFDLEGMMWSGSAGDAPPLPHGAPPPLPTSTPPPPPH